MTRQELQRRQRRQKLQRYFYDHHIKHYGSSGYIMLPFFGGFIELEVSHNHGMIELQSATSNVMGCKSRCDYFALGYTDPIGISRSAAIALEKLEEEARSQFALKQKEVLPDLG